MLLLQELLIASYLNSRHIKTHPELHQVTAPFKRTPANWAKDSQAYIESLQSNPANIASRKASQNALNAFGPLLPELMGGSADLAGSNLTIWNGCKGLEANDASGNYIYYGVREFGMSRL